MNNSILKTSFFLFAILATVSCKDSGSQLVESRIESRITSDSRTISVYLPDGYSKKETYPVVYVGDAVSFISGDYCHILDSLTIHGIIRPVVVACTYNSKGVSASSSESFNIDYFADEFIPFVQSKYSVSTDRADNLFFGISQSADAGIKMSFDRPGLFSEYWCFSPLKTDVSSFLALDSPTSYKIVWVNKDELKVSFDYFPSMVNALKKRGASVKTKVLETVPSTLVWRQEFIRLLTDRFGVEEQ